MQDPNISVVLPVYNRSEFLIDAIDSVLNQTMNDFELIIVDDGSSNAECLKIINDYERKDARVRIIHQENHGSSHARNTGITSACGQYIACMDDDDVNSPSRFEKQVAFLTKHPNVAVVLPSSTYIDAQGAPLTKQPKPISKPCIYEPRDWQKLEDIDICVRQCTMWRADVLKEIKFNSFYMCGIDTDIALRTAEKYPIAFIPDNLYYYRKYDKRSPSLSSNEYILYYRFTAYLCAHRRKQGKPEPIGENTDVLDLIPLFKELPTAVIVYLLKQLRHKSNRLLYNRKYDRLEALLANMDKAFLDSEHTKAYSRIRKKNLQALTLKALQHGRWGWFAHRLSNTQTRH